MFILIQDVVLSSEEPIDLHRCHCHNSAFLLFRDYNDAAKYRERNNGKCKVHWWSMYRLDPCA